MVMVVMIMMVMVMMTIQVRLVPFTHRGSFWRFDGEIFVRKGVSLTGLSMFMLFFFPKIWDCFEIKMEGVSFVCPSFVWHVSKINIFIALLFFDEQRAQQLLIADIFCMNFISIKTVSLCSQKSTMPCFVWADGFCCRWGWREYSGRGGLLMSSLLILSRTQR